MDINQLFTEDGMREATSAWRENHMSDGQQYAQVAEIIRARLKQERIVGDRGAMSAKVRAWKVARHAKKLSRLARRQAAGCEALNSAYVNQVVKLPERRAIEARIRSDKRQQRAINAGAMVSKSLQKTATTLNGTPASPQVNAPQEAFLDAEPFAFPQAVGAESHDMGSIGDYFASEAGR
jgi:hypothetical protein